ncbi:hypothetical protein D9599_23475 [Roseomonas sp. KE2513]|nr:hypothetical protein [Roseomonas sp. KE2513]
MREAETQAGAGDPSGLRDLQPPDMVVHAPGTSILDGDTRRREALYAQNRAMADEGRCHGGASISPVAS